LSYASWLKPYLAKLCAGLALRLAQIYLESLSCYVISTTLGMIKG